MEICGIEEAIKIVKKIRQDYNLYYPMDRKEVEAIETLLTAYEKEKEKIRKMLQELEDRRNKQPVIGYWSKKAMLEKLLKEE